MARFRTVALVASLAVAGWAPRTLARSSYYTSSCGSCHGSATSTCNGCHAHGTHSDSSKSDVALSGTLDRASYAPGATVTATVSGGYRSGWVRVVLLDAAMHEVARSGCPGNQGGCSTAGFPVTLTATAPSSPGTYAWAVAWYGNADDATGASFGAGTSATLKPGSFTPDANNANHGWQVVALPTFTVSGTAAPAISVAPTSLAFGTVGVGATASRTLTVSNTGSATLTGAVARAQGTSPEYGVSPATLSVAPGAHQIVTVTYAPVDGSADSGSLAVTSNDASSPSVSVAVSGAGTTAALPSLALAPAAVDFGSVDVGASSSLGVELRNGGTAPLSVASVARCTSPATSDEFGGSMPSAAPITIAAGQSVTVTLSYAPADVGADAGCFVVTSDDPQNPTMQVDVSGAGAPGDGTIGRAKGGCNTGAGAGATAVILAVAALAARRRRREVA